ncbi:protein kinase [Streptomyces sp. NPDC059373]
MPASTGVRVERGETIAGRYELVKRLGRGGMGEVWAGRDRTLHRDVAIKILVPDNPALQELSWRFEREAVAAAQISHPNVVALYDRGVHEDVLFLVMEKVEGATLSEHIHDKSPMDPTSALTIAQGICAALIAAHRAGVIHYDIKPHNVMLTADRQVKVVDFGIAGFIQTAFTLARSSQLTPAGTIEYGAPEQFLSERGDERSDLYALGSVLFAMLTGRPPFTGQYNAMAILRRKLDEDAPRIDSLRSDLSPALTTLVAELLDRDPMRRPESAQKVHDRIRGLQANVDSTTPLPRSTERGGVDELALPEWLVETGRATAEGSRTNGVTGRSDATGQEDRGPGLAPGAQSPSTRQLPEPVGPFAVSWTGKEPLSSYADSTRERGQKGLGITTGALGLVSLVGFYLPFHYDPDGIARDDSPWAGSIVGATIFALAAVGCAVAAIFRAHQERLAQNKTGWTLHVGPHGIVTTGAKGRREFTWDQIQRVTIERIAAGGPFGYTGVHLRPERGAGRPTNTPPAMALPAPGSL